VRVELARNGNTLEGAALTVDAETLGRLGAHHQPDVEMRAFAVCCLFVFSLTGCDSGGGSEDPPDADPLPRIVVSSSTRFATADGAAFTPWGYNYTNTATGLVEDAWDRESAWATFEEDFREMKSYGANVVRIHLQFHEYMDSPTEPSASALARLKRLVELAEKTGLYLDVTGLAAYRKSDQPAWYDDLSEADRWAAQAVFWEAVARVGAQSDNVFCYNLMNEPVVLAPPQPDWLPGAGFGGYHFIQSLTRDLGTRINVDVYNDWIAMQAAAVRRGDPRHLVTVGFLPLGDLKRFEANLDFLSTHIYPKTDEIQASVDYVRSNVGVKPLLIEEIGPLSASSEQTLDFIDRTDNVVAGVISHYMGDTIGELEAQNTIAAAIQAEWLRVFSARSPVN